NNGWFKKFSDFSAGMGDAVSGGLTARMRQGMGYDDVVDYNSTAYRVGTYAGQAVTIATVAVNPAAAAGAVGWVRTAQTALNAMNMANGAISAGEAYRNGDTLGVVTSLAGAGLSSLRGMGSVCQNAGRFARFGRDRKS